MGIFKLINSLSKSEKRHLSLHFKNSDTNHYKLFKLVEKYGVAEEKKIKEQFLGKNYSHLKKYLFKSILTKLIVYDVKKHDIYVKFSMLEVLYQRGLMEDALKITKDIYTIANKTNDYLSLLKLISYLKQILPYCKKPKKEFLDILDKENIFSETQNIISQLEAFKLKICNYIDHLEHPFHDNDTNTISQIIHNVEAISNKIKNRRTEQLYHEIMLIYGFVTQNKTLLSIHEERMHQLISKAEKINPFAELQITKYILFSRAMLNKFEDVLLCCDQMENLLSKTFVTELEKIDTLTLIYSYRLLSLLRINSLKKAREFHENKYSKFMNEYKKKIKKYGYMYYQANLVVLAFLEKDYRSSLSLSNQFIQDNSKSYNSLDILYGLRVIEIISSYELKYFDLYESRINSFKRTINSRKNQRSIWITVKDFMCSLLIEENKLNNGQKFISRLELVDEQDMEIKEDLYYLEEWVKSYIKS